MCIRDSRRTLQESLADRIVLQVDQTTLADQTLPRHHRKRRKDPDMVRHRHLCACLLYTSLVIIPKDLIHPCLLQVNSLRLCILNLEVEVFEARGSGPLEPNYLKTIDLEVQSTL